MAGDVFDKFSVYGFSIEYPAVCRVEFNPKSLRDTGDVVFHFPDREKLFVSWGRLERAEKKFPTVEAHAEHSITAVSKSRTVKNAEKLEQGSIEINSHKAAYTRMRLTEMQPGFFPGKKTVTRETHSVHLHCGESSRYFVIYSYLSSNAPKEFGDLVKTMAYSFKCH